MNHSLNIFHKQCKIGKLFSTSIDAIIFDLDGTLLDSMAHWIGLGERYLLHHGKTPHADARDHFNRQTLEESAQYIQETYNIEKTIPEIMEGILDGIEYEYAHEIPLKPYAREFLEACKQHNIECIIATASERRLFEPALLRLDVDSFFSHSFVCSEVGASKTESLVFDAARDFAHMPAKHMLVIDDSIHAIETAKDAGYPTVAILSEHNIQYHDQLKATADVAVHSFEELL